MLIAWPHHVLQWPSICFSDSPEHARYGGTSVKLFCPISPILSHNSLKYLFLRNFGTFLRKFPPAAVSDVYVNFVPGLRVLFCPIITFNMMTALAMV